MEVNPDAANEAASPKAAGRAGSPSKQGSPSCVRAFEKGGDGIPFFCVAPISGLVLAYMPVCKLLGGSHPFYALEHPGLQDASEPCTTVESLAERLLSEVDSFFLPTITETTISQPSGNGPDSNRHLKLCGKGKRLNQVFPRKPSLQENMGPLCKH